MTEASKPRIDFARIKPDAPGEAGPSPEAVDRVAEAHGFVSREPEERRYRRPSQAAATVPLSIRPPVAVANRFIAYCDAERLSYWQGLDALMKKAGV